MTAATATITAPQAERISLYFKEGGSDKVYQCSIEPQGDLFVVNFAFGRPGSTLTTGTKTQAPVDYDAAKRVYDKLVREKTAKGYTQGQDGTPYQHTQAENRVSGVLPQLLNPIDEPHAKRLLKNSDWCMQEKFDGKRMILRKRGDTLTAINRKGLVIGLISSVGVSALNISHDFIIDGECVGDMFHAFDLLERDGKDYRPQPYIERTMMLSRMLDLQKTAHIQFARTATDPESKERMFQQLKARKGEGVVFKRLDAPYTPGRPNSGGNQLKHKFYATCSAVVSGINDKRSVELRLLNGKGWQVVGNVTIPVNYEIPQVGQVVEIRYLYAFPESHALYQPVYLGERHDVEQHECVLSQLKYKASDSDGSDGS